MGTQTDLFGAPIQNEPEAPPAETVYVRAYVRRPRKLAAKLAAKAVADAPPSREVLEQARLAAMFSAPFGTAPHKLVRPEHPGTSHAAARAVNTSKLEREVYEVIVSRGEAGIISDEVLAFFPDRPYSSVTARYKALAEKGFIYYPKTVRKGRSGRNQRVMVDAKNPVIVARLNAEAEARRKAEADAATAVKNIPPTNVGACASLSKSLQAVMENWTPPPRRPSCEYCGNKADTAGGILHDSGCPSLAQGS